MKKAAGFTLIELVIVIVILGILGAVAAPRFLNLQGDAYGANVNALKGSIQSAMTLGNTKAILEGKDKGAGQDVSIDGIDGDVDFDFGYPSATENGILKLLDIDGDAESVSAAANTAVPYNFVTSTSGGTSTLNVFPSARFDDREACGVIYTQATSAAKATVSAEINGC
jgi:MSHA pilin protein MshA